MLSGYIGFGLFSDTLVWFSGASHETGPSGRGVHAVFHDFATSNLSDSSDCLMALRTMLEPKSSTSLY